MLWVSNLESQIFTIVKAKTEHLKELYPTINFTATPEFVSASQFPTVCIREVACVERGQDLENIGVNAVNETIQVDVITTTSMQDAKKIMFEVLTVFKEMRFNILEFPMNNSGDNNTFRTFIRCNRLIGANDRLL